LWLWIDYNIRKIDKEKIGKLEEIRHGMRMKSETRSAQKMIMVMSDETQISCLYSLTVTDWWWICRIWFSMLLLFWEIGNQMIRVSLQGNVKNRSDVKVSSHLTVFPHSLTVTAPFLFLSHFIHANAAPFLYLITLFFNVFLPKINFTFFI